MEMVDRSPGALYKDGVVARRSSRSLAEATARYEALAAQLVTVGVIASGSHALRSHRCGKANCACTADPPRLHGPYWHYTAKVAGKTVNRRLRETEASAYHQWIANDR